MQMWLLVFSLLVVSSAQASARQCHDLFRAGSIPFSQKVEFLQSNFDADKLTQKLSRKMRRLEREGYNLHLELERIFQWYLEERLAFLPEMQRLEVRNLIENHLFSEYSKDVIDGSIDNLSGEIHAIIPRALKGTLVEYFVRVHEIEHAIQKVTVGLMHPTHSRRSRIVYILNLEKGAVRSEGAFLRSFPPYFLEAALVQSTILALRAAKKEKFSLLLNALDNAIHSKNVEEYIQLTISQDRYSLRKIQLMIFFGIY